MEKLLPVEENGTKWLPLARKSVSTSQNEGFVEKQVYTRRK